MPEEWSGEVVKIMHLKEISQGELAREMGVSKPYVSMLLRGVRQVDGAREKIEKALAAILKRKESA